MNKILGSSLEAAYRAVKATVSGAVLFYRMGDYYELFFEDATENHKLLQITLTTKNGLPMAGVAPHMLEACIAQLTASGRDVAVCEPMGDVKKSEGRTLPRGVVRYEQAGVKMKIKIKPLEWGKPNVGGRITARCEVMGWFNIYNSLGIFWGEGHGVTIAAASNDIQRVKDGIESYRQQCVQSILVRADP